MPSSSPITVGAVNTFVEGLARGENELSYSSSENAVRVQIKNVHSGYEVDLKDDVFCEIEKSISAEEQKEFQLQLAQTCFDTGIDYWSNEDYDNAMVEFQRSLEIREDISGRLSEGTAKGYLWVGSIHLHRKDYEKALDNFNRAYRIRLGLSGGAKEQCAVIKNWINKVLKSQGLSEKEKEIHWKKFQCCIDHEDKADKLFVKQRFQTAVEEYRTALQFELRRRGLSANTPGRPLADAADLYCKIARCFWAQGFWARAMVEYRQGLAIYLAKFGRHQRYSVQTHHRLGEVAYKMGFRDEIIEEYLGQVYDSILFEKTADMLLDRNQNEEAIDEYLKTLDLEETLVGKLQVHCALIYLKIAKAHIRLGNQASSLLFCSKALGIFDMCLGRNHKQTVAAMNIIKTITSGAQYRKQSMAQR